MTGFTGSAGTAVVTADEALLWTDSRYWNQFSLQVDATLWTLMKSGQPKVPKISKWLAELAVKHYTAHKTELVVGIDPFVHPASFADEVYKAFDEEAQIELSSGDDDGDDDANVVSIGRLETSHSNLIDPIWGAGETELLAHL